MLTYTAAQRKMYNDALPKLYDLYCQPRRVLVSQIMCSSLIFLARFSQFSLTCTFHLAHRTDFSCLLSHTKHTHWAKPSNSVGAACGATNPRFQTTIELPGGDPRDQCHVCSGTIDFPSLLGFEQLVAENILRHGLLILTL